MAFQKASKRLAKAKILLTGPSGAGKTFSALRLARGLGGRVAVIDTENNSASLYADQFPGWEYDVCSLTPPYTAQKYFQAIEDAERAVCYDILIIDSATHLWAGEGGLLDQKSAADSRGGNSFTNWKTISELNERFKSRVLHSKLHIICTARSKQEYIMEANEKGKSAPRKVGLAPILRDGMEYEFTVVFDIGMDHQFIVSKDRTNLFDGHVALITETTGATIKSWLFNDVQAESIVKTEEPAPEPKTAEPDWLTEAAAKVPDEPRELTEIKERNLRNECDAERLNAGQPLLTDEEFNALKIRKGTVAVTKLAAAVESKEALPPPSLETRYAPPSGGHSNDLDVALGNSADPKTYKIPFGKYQGKTISQIGLKVAEDYLSYIESEAEQNGKPIRGKVAEFQQMVNLARRK